METLGTKVVVLGVGSAGCRMIRQLASSNPSAELIAIDREAGPEQLESVREIAVGQMLAEGRGADSIRAALAGEGLGISAALEGASMAVILGSLGGRTASSLMPAVADICSSRGVFTLIVAAYPLMSMGGAEGAEEKVNLLRHHSSGVVVIDNNLNLEKGDVAPMEIFDRINSVINEFVILLINSISGAGYMSMAADELMHFFHGDLHFALTAGRGSNAAEASVRAIEDVHRYMGHSGVKRMLMLAAGPAEVGLDELRALNDEVQNKYSPDAVKWVGAYSSSEYTDILAVSALGEMPLVRGIEQPASAVSLGLELGRPAEEKEAVEEPAGERIAEMLVEKPVEMPAERAAEKPVEKKPERPQSSLETNLRAGSKEPRAEPPRPAPVFFDFKNLGPYSGAQKKPFKSPALIGLAQPEKKPPAQGGGKQARESGPQEYDARGVNVYALGKPGQGSRPAENGYIRPAVRDEPPRRGDELSEMAEDLTGFPAEEIRPHSKKPQESQRRMKDYSLDDVRFV